MTLHLSQEQAQREKSVRRHEALEPDMLRATILSNLLILPVASLLIPWATPPPRCRLPSRGGCVRMLEDGDWDSFSREMKELRERISAEGYSAAKLGPPDQVLEDVSKAWVLIFNPGRNDEGVVSQRPPADSPRCHAPPRACASRVARNARTQYTLQGRNGPASSYVLAFETTDEAMRFAELLAADGFDMAQPAEWRSEQLRAFCKMGKLDVGMVPGGTLLTPPSHNEFDADAYARLEAQEKTLSTQLEVSGPPARSAAPRTRSALLCPCDPRPGAPWSPDRAGLPASTPCGATRRSTPSAPRTMEPL